MSSPGSFSDLGDHKLGKVEDSRRLAGAGPALRTKLEPT